MAFFKSLPFRLLLGIALAYLSSVLAACVSMCAGYGKSLEYLMFEHTENGTPVRNCNPVYSDVAQETTFRFLSDGIIGS